MKTRRFLVVLTVLNLILLSFLLLTRTRPALAYTGADVLRGTALEIVDSRGRVRASIKVQPAETFKATGRKYPETVVLRLIDQHGRPEVKIVASVEGGGLSLVGDSDAIRAQLHADRAESSLRLTNTAGRERLIGAVTESTVFLPSHPRRRASAPRRRASSSASLPPSPDSPSRDQDRSASPPFRWGRPARTNRTCP
jgi:hypothetical protein